MIIILLSVAIEVLNQIGNYGDDITDLMVKFNRDEVINLLSATDYSEDTGKYSEVPLTITGEDEGTTFESVDTVRVLTK